MAILFSNPDHKLTNTTVSKSPTEDGQPQLSPSITKFIQQYTQIQLSKKTGAEPTIRVSDVLGSLAHLYEKIRNIVEYKGEHVLRRNAIERMLRRLIRDYGTYDLDRISHVLVRELIWARYLPNDSVPRSKIKHLHYIIRKYLILLDGLKRYQGSLGHAEIKNWVWGIASSEIEESLDASTREIYVELMATWFKANFVWQDASIPEKVKNIQVYLAIHRALTKSDDEIMCFHRLVQEKPHWLLAQENDVLELANSFPELYREIEANLQFPDHLIMYRLLKTQTAPFEVLSDLVTQYREDLTELFKNSPKFNEAVRSLCQRKYLQIRGKVSRGIVRSIVYIFVTKVIFALLIEIPYELFRYGKLSYIPLSINVIVPPAMMWLVGLTIKTPDESNTRKILDKLQTVLYHDINPVRTSFSLKPAHRNQWLTTIFAGIYLILFLLVFGVITYFLFLLHFNIVGAFIFFAFLSLILLFGFRVKYTASELKVTTDKDDLFNYLFNNLTLPFLRIGVYLSKGLARLNFFTVILDFLIEAPLKSIIEVVDEWTSFIREKREEVIEIPEQ